MAAAAVFAGDSAVPPDSRNVATAVNQFVAHVPAPGAVPGAEAHLPAGVDPAHAVGPVPEAAPVAGTGSGGGARRPRPSRHLIPARGARRPRGRGARVRSGRPADAGLHVSVDQ